MNYRSIYANLIARASVRDVPIPSERHHIVPRCCGGSNDRSNIVRLSPREHFFCHFLLVKMHPEVDGLKLAVALMSGRVKGLRSRAYQKIRAEVAARRSEKQRGVKRPVEHMEAMWHANRTRKRTEDHCKSLSAAKTGKKLSADHRRRISEGGRGRKNTAEHILKSAKGQSSLPDSVILAMRSEYERGGVMDHISRKYGVSLSLGARIMKRESYKWVA